MWIRHYRDTIHGESLAGDVTPYAIEGRLRHRCLSGTWEKSRHQFDDTHGIFLLTYDTAQTSRGMRLTGNYLAKEGASVISNDYQLSRIHPISFLQKHFRSAARRKARELCQEKNVPLELEDELHSSSLDSLPKTKAVGK
jgi:hypothetical protein